MTEHQKKQIADLNARIAKLSEKPGAQRLIARLTMAMQQITRS